MIQPIEVSRTEVTPSVLFRPEEGVLALAGDCYPENPALFFGPIFSALERHFRAGGVGRISVTFQLSYVNSASTKALRRLFGLLNAMGEHGMDVEVCWRHDPDDDTLAELGQDLADGLHFVDYRGVAEALPLAS